MSWGRRWGCEQGLRCKSFSGAGVGKTRACYGVWNSRGPGLSHHTTCGGWERALRPSCIARIPWLEPMGSVWSLISDSRDIKGSDEHVGFFSLPSSCRYLVGGNMLG